MQSDTLVMWPEANVEYYKRGVQIAGMRSDVKAIEERLTILRKEVSELDRLNEDSAKLEKALRDALAVNRKNSERLMWLYYNGVCGAEGGSPTFEEWCASLDAAQAQKEAAILAP